MRPQGHLVDVGKQIRLKQHIRLLSELLDGIDGHRFYFYVISAAPQEVIQSALEGIVPEDHIFGTQFRYDAATGEIQSIARVPAGYGKVAVLDELRTRLLVSHDRVVYVGDGSSDVHVMLHVNRLDGLTIAVSENKFITQIAARTVLSDDALSVLIPVLEDIVGWNSTQIRSFFEAHGFVLRDWEKVRTDSLTIGHAPSSATGYARQLSNGDCVACPRISPNFRLFPRRDFRVEPISQEFVQVGRLGDEAADVELLDPGPLPGRRRRAQNCHRHRGELRTSPHRLQNLYAVVLGKIEVQHDQIGRRASA